MSEEPLENEDQLDECEICARMKKIPNAETLRAFREIEEDKNLKRYTLEEFIKLLWL